MTEVNSERSHARLAPSAAHRWSECPGSAVLEAQIPDTSSTAAEEGTAAHELAAHCLNMGFDTKRFMGRKIDVNGDSIATMFLAKGAPDGPGIYLVDDEMVEHVLDYIKLVRTTVDGANGEMGVEKRVYAKAIHEDCHGTADAVVYRPDTKTLHVFDLKYGRGVVVEAEGNKQCAIYASGARTLKHNREIDKIVVHIFQPRAPHPKGSHRTWELTPEELDALESDLSACAVSVDDAEDQFVLPNVAALNWEGNFLVAGDHCRFCKTVNCSARANQALETAQTEFGDTTSLRSPDGMSSDELASVLTKARQIQHWIKAVEEHAAAEAKAGRLPTGFKQVAGRSSRAWSDEEKLQKLLPVFCSVDVKDLYEEPKLLSPAKLGKLLPKDERSSVAPFITKRQGGTQLVPDDDPRPAIRPDAASEFGDTSDDT